MSKSHPKGACFLLWPCWIYSPLSKTYEIIRGCGTHREINLNLLNMHAAFSRWFSDIFITMSTFLKFCWNKLKYHMWGSIVFPRIPLPIWVWLGRAVGDSFVWDLEGIFVAHAYCCLPAGWSCWCEAGARPPAAAPAPGSPSSNFWARHVWQAVSWGASESAGHSSHQDLREWELTGVSLCPCELHGFLALLHFTYIFLFLFACSLPVCLFSCCLPVPTPALQSLLNQQSNCVRSNYLCVCVDIYMKLKY